MRDGKRKTRINIDIDIHSIFPFPPFPLSSFGLWKTEIIEQSSELLVNRFCPLIRLCVLYTFVSAGKNKKKNLERMLIWECHGVEE